ncbi:MAG: hypothetical protein K5745_04695 [Saccharofermentans sp.]|nr:hypothetical protein [Saccharofermentans sp.]
MDALKKINIAQLTGYVLMPAIAGIAFGAYLAFRLYSGLITDIETSQRKTVDLEYGNPITLDIFFEKVPVNTKFITNVGLIDPGLLASYDIAIDCGGHVVHSVLNVVDSTAPTATAVPVEMYCGEAPDPNTLVTDIFDLTKVTVEYDQGIPDLSKGGNFDIGVRLTDTSGNSSVVMVPFYVKDDHIAPTITGAGDISVVVGDTISYRSGITIKDNFDPDPDLKIDNSLVDLNVVGIYPLTYTVTDEVGNSRSLTVNVSVVSRPSAGVTGAEDEETIAQAYEMAEAVLDDILKVGMTDVEKAMKICYWVYHNIYFVSGTSDYTSWAAGAIKAFTTRRASCYGRWAATKALLDCAGIENICITRDSQYNHRVHYWCLCYINGGWYHCDPQYWGTAQYGYFIFMMTDDDLKRAYGNHDFNAELYPERATESVQRYINVFNGYVSPDFPYAEGD